MLTISFVIPLPNIPKNITTKFQLVELMFFYKNDYARKVSIKKNHALFQAYWQLKLKFTGNRKKKQDYTVSGRSFLPFPNSLKLVRKLLTFNKKQHSNFT